MIYIPIIIAIVIIFYMLHKNDVVRKENNALPNHNNSYYAYKRAPCPDEAFMLVGVLAAAYITLLWLGPDGVETVRQFMAPRVVIVRQ